ncbi:MAG: hypothetical protein C4324_10995 [Blastocatellia bacterium]
MNRANFAIRVSSDDDKRIEGKFPIYRRPLLRSLSEPDFGIAFRVRAASFAWLKPGEKIPIKC